MRHKGSIHDRLYTMKCGYLNGEAFDTPRRSFSTQLSRARLLVRDGEWPKWDWEWEHCEGDAADKLIYVWKKRIRI